MQSHSRNASLPSWMAGPLLFGLTVAVTWPSWRWFGARIAAAPDEALPLALAVLFLALLALPRLVAGAGLALVPPWPLASMLAAYAVAEVAAVPPIFKAALAALAALWILYRAVFGSSPPAAFYGLAALSLPVLPSLQFVLGYPMRLVSAQLTVGLLTLQGVPIERQGTYVVWQGEMAQFDAPCSGVSMLWALVLLTLMMALVRRFSILATLAAVGFAILAAIAANVLRVASLLHLDIVGAAVSVDDPLHEAVGVVAFALAGAGMVWLMTGWPGDTRGRRFSGAVASGSVLAWLGVGLSVAAAAGAPSWAPELRPVAATADDGFPGWPQSYEGAALTALPLTARETALARDFPGRIGRFSDGRREIVLRWVSEPTRRLHPAADCFRGLGYAIVPIALRRTSDGAGMGCFRAKGTAGEHTVCEGLRSASGRASWSDVSAWYWETLFDGRSGPWWSVVVAE